MSLSPKSVRSPTAAMSATSTVPPLPSHPSPYYSGYTGPASATFESNHNHHYLAVYNNNDNDNDDNTSSYYATHHSSPPWDRPSHLSHHVGHYPQDASAVDVYDDQVRV